MVEFETDNRPPFSRVIIAGMLVFVVAGSVVGGGLLTWSVMRMRHEHALRVLAAEQAAERERAAIEREYLERLESDEEFVEAVEQHKRNGD